MTGGGYSAKEGVKKEEKRKGKKAYLRGSADRGHPARIAGEKFGEAKIGDLDLSIGPAGAKQKVFGLIRDGTGKREGTT